MKGARVAVRTGVVKGPKAAWVAVAMVSAKAGSIPIAIKPAHIHYIYISSKSLEIKQSFGELKN